MAEKMPDEIESETRAFAALMNGDLHPIAEHIWKYGGVPKSIAMIIADAINGEENVPIRLTVKRSYPGAKNWTDQNADHQRKMEIGFFIQDSLNNCGRGEYEAVIADAKNKFGISATTAAKALSYIRQEHEGAGGSADEWEAYRQLFSTP